VGGEGVPGVLLTGTVGVGKTAVAVELGRVLAERGQKAAVIDLDWLGWLTGAGAVDTELLIRDNLVATWVNYRDRGATRVVLVRMISDPRHLAALRNTLEDVSLTVVRITTSPERIEARLRKRDTGAELEEHLAESGAMTTRLDASKIEDLQVSNDATAHDAAVRLLELLAWDR
jgi:CobQ/CobB/MinD/ParA nucleotide binding domain